MPHLHRSHYSELAPDWYAGPRLIGAIWVAVLARRLGVGQIIAVNISGKSVLFCHFDVFLGFVHVMHGIVGHHRVFRKEGQFARETLLYSYRFLNRWKSSMFRIALSVSALCNARDMRVVQ